MARTSGSTRLRYRTALAIGFGASLLTLAAAAVGDRIVHAADQRIYDAMLAASPVGDGTLPGVAVVGVDEASLAEVGRWPWPRTILAALVDSLRARGTTAVALDLLLSEPDVQGGPSGLPGVTRNDSVLLRALERAPAVPGYAITFEGARSLAATPCGITALPVVEVAPPPDVIAEAEIVSPTGALCPLAAITASARYVGFLNGGADADGILRRAPLFARAGNDLVPSLALAAALRARTAEGLPLGRTRGGDLRFELHGRRFHLDRHGTMLVPFRGPAGTAAFHSAADVLAGRLPPDAIRGRVVFVGATALGLEDALPTPMGLTYPGVEVHATLAAALLDGQAIGIPSWSRAALATATLLVGPLVAFLAIWGTLVAGAAAAAVVVLGGLAACWATLAASGIFVSPVLPAVAALVAIATVIPVQGAVSRTAADSERRRREQTQRFALESLTALVETRDRSTGRHARRTAAYAVVLARRLRASPRFAAYLTDEHLTIIEQLAPLHDIGKVGVADAVLNKRGPLTDEEFAQIREHPELGFQTIQRAEHDARLDADTSGDVIRIAKDIVRSHHERWDGQGYPRRLTGEEIPIPARIMAVVDVYDALVQSRVYRPAMTHATAASIVVDGRGTAFDPDVVDAFLAVQHEFEAMTERFRTDGDAPADRAEGPATPA